MSSAGFALTAFIALLSAAAATAAAAAAATPWDAYNLSPRSRSISVGSGAVPVTLTPASPSALFDFEKEVGGDVVVSVGAVSGGASRLSLAFSESTYYVTSSDNSNGGSGADGALLLNSVVAPNTNYSQPRPQLRGGFRYLRVFLAPGSAADSRVQLLQVTLLFSPAPSMPDPSNYANHFFCSDDLINRVWWAGAYTVQLSTIDPQQARVWPPPTSGWDNSASAGLGSSILVDGAKRDRMVWGGDCGVSIPTAYVSTGDTLSAANAVATLLLQCQHPDGIISMVGPPICNFFSSDTYHLWALIGVCNVFQYTQDTAWLTPLWPHFVAGTTASAAKIGSTGLMHVNLNSDWARSGMGGENIAGETACTSSRACVFTLSPRSQRAALQIPLLRRSIVAGDGAAAAGGQVDSTVAPGQIPAAASHLAVAIDAFHLTPTPPLHSGASCRQPPSVGRRRWSLHRQSIHHPPPPGRKLTRRSLRPRVR